ncbi:alpha/beta hydrolase family protein [Chryseolinea soli]|uniref:PET hydrolase/cutinase-like domain-containing protein n=1 Tax=Chryseolinea soli TaxID=2321403 RepID=A0A385SUU9_9BACT|nr:hypothetical protein [Chryseolinea soli]AYB33745.1 hypothetical protein D4L85_25585 [Chryseolinea soli]
MNSKFNISGIVRERESGLHLSDLQVKAYDKDLLYDDLLGNALTDKSGRFEINYEGPDFRELFDKRPDIYFKVMDPLGKRILHTTSHSVRWNAGAKEHFEIEIPAHKLPPKKDLTVTLIDAHGKHRSDFEIGESLMINITGLAQNAPYHFSLSPEKEAEVFHVTLISNRFGVIAPTVLWPDIGIGVPGAGGKFAFETHEEALAAMANRTFHIEVTGDKKTVANTRFTISPEQSGTKLYSASRSGALQRGLLLGKDELVVQGKNFQPGALIDIYLVKRKFSWRAGDRIEPILNLDGSEVMTTVQLAPQEKNFNVVLWSQEQLRTGSYDILARVTTLHEYLRGERKLRKADIVSDRFITSVVVRDDIFHYKPIHQGCVMATKEIAATMLWGVPEEVKYTNNFPKGTDVWAALDPAGLMPGAIGKKVKFYVIPHKSPGEWSMSSSLVSVPGSGSPEIITSPSCVNSNATLVWSNPQQAGKYDLVVDFGNNDPDPAHFVADGSFDPPADMIDGYLNVGFYVTDDPSVPGPYAVGQTSYNDPAVTIPAIGVWAPDPTNPIFGDTLSGTLDLPMTAEVRYPAVVNGVNTPVSPGQANYPLVVVMHGMHGTGVPNHLGYNYLLEHLASHGFIAVSIDCNAINDINGAQDTRGHAILEHLALLQSKNNNPGLLFGKIDMTNIGIMGHSRGGDGVVQAEIYNQTLGLGWNIKVIVPLAPTDFSGTSPTPLNLTTSKLFCIYGSNDADVWGGATPSTQYTGTGFRFYDRATVEKSMAFIYGAIHNRFNTQWGTEFYVDASSPKILSAAQHQVLLCGYMTACMQVYLQGRTEQIDYLTGELKIPAVSTVEVHSQFRRSSQTLDDFETAPALNLNSAGGAVTFANLDGSPQEDTVGVIDSYSPHQTKGLRLKWNALTGTYQSQIPLSGSLRNLTALNFLSFRVTQKVASAANPVDQLQDMHVRLTTAAGGNSRAIRVGYFGNIPFPYKPEYRLYDLATMTFDLNSGYETENVKAAFKTIRIPLYAWTIKCLNVPIVDTSNVEFITFEFDHLPTGEIEIDDIEFTL